MRALSLLEVCWSAPAKRTDGLSPSRRNRRWTGWSGSNKWQRILEKIFQSFAGFRSDAGYDE
eukprot:m.189696 g.189696  ORF g.189696 m.189696 type:complete len:62 (+) comp15115_c0_seq1:376-561(+)